MLRRFFKSEHGNYTVVFAIAMLPIMTGVAGVVDYATTTRDAAALQNALDATGLAVATKYYSAMSPSELETLGYDVFMANLRFMDKQDPPLDVDLDPLMNFKADATGSGSLHYITVSASIKHPGFVGGITWSANRKAVVKVSAGQDACVLALNPHASRAMQFQGSTSVDMAGCVIASNSDADDSFYRGGSARLSALCAISAGGAVGLDSNTTLQCGQPRTHLYPSFDPLEDVDPPTYGNCTKAPNGGKTTTLTQGTYCGVNLKGDVALNAGVYIFKGGQLNFNGNGSLVGKGVSIFLTDGASLTLNGNAVVDLSPPASGPYAGITIYQARDNTSALTINGTSGSNMTGYVYAPAAPISYTGNSSVTSQDCIRIIGDTVTMSGNSYTKTDCTADLGGRLIYVGRSMTLVQ